MKVSTCVPIEPAETLDSDDPAFEDRLAELWAPPDGAWLRTNLVTSLDGRVSGTDGTSNTLSSPVDRALLRAIRRGAELVLVGAETVRAERYVLPSRNRLAIVTGSGKLGEVRLPKVGEPAEVLVLGPPEAEAAARACLPVSPTFVPLPSSDEGIEPRVLMDALHAAGATRIVCEGGPGLVGQLFSAGLVDEACLSTSPRIAGEGRVLFDGVAPTQLERVALMVDELGFSYSRWRRPVGTD